MEFGVTFPTFSAEVRALPVELEEVLGSSEEGEGEEEEEEVEGGDTDRSSGDRTPWLSSSS